MMSGLEQGSITKEIMITMKQLISTMFVLILGLTFLQAQDCDKNQRRYEQLMKNDQMKAAYPIWKGQLEDCPKSIVNIYNHAEVILPPLIETATGAEKEQYIDDLIKAYTQRLQYFPENKNMFIGDKVSYELAYGRIDSLDAHQKLKEVFNKATNDRSKLSFTTINTFFNNALTLYYYKKISDEEYVTVYDNIKKGIQLNVDLRNEEKAPLEDKIYGKTDSLGNVLVPKSKLTYKEQQIYDNDTANISFLKKYEGIYDDYFAQYLELNCYNLDRLVNEGYDKNVDNNEWLLQYYYLMLDKECDSPAYAKVEARLMVLYPPEPGQDQITDTDGPSRSVNNCALQAQKLYKSGQYSAAIEKFKCAIESASSNNTKGSYAANIANCYSKLGSYSNTVTWANKALNYKPGYDAAYLLIANAYYKGAGQLPGDQYKQRAAGWVAADYARRAGRADIAAQYDRSAPSSEECFLQGITKGSSYKVGGWINKTTTARCVKR